MSVEQLQQQLNECFNISQDPTIKQAAQTANQYTEMFKAGQLSKDEYTQLMGNISNVNAISNSTGDLQALEFMNLAIRGLIKLAAVA